MTRKIAAQIWTVHKVFDVPNWGELNRLIPSEVDGPDAPYACIEKCLLVQRKIPESPKMDSCLRLHPFRIPGGNSLFPIIWDDKIWHKAGDWSRWHYQSRAGYLPQDHPRPIRGYRWNTIPIPEHPSEEQWELVGIYTPNSDRRRDLSVKYPEIPTEWKQVLYSKHSRQDYPVDVEIEV